MKFFNAIATAAFVGTSLITVAPAAAFWNNNQKKIVGVWKCQPGWSSEIKAEMVMDFKSNQTFWGKTTYTDELTNAEAKAIETSYGKYKVQGNRLTVYDQHGKTENRSTEVGNTAKENKKFREWVNDNSEVFRDREPGRTQDSSFDIVNLTRNNLVIASEGGGSRNIICSKM